jgi:hypothetical protein
MVYVLVELAHIMPELTGIIIHKKVKYAHFYQFSGYFNKKYWKTADSGAIPGQKWTPKLRQWLK